LVPSQKNLLPTGVPSWLRACSELHCLA